ncbi:MAG TPA: AAA family ATPase [Chitinophagaceae bacterium]|nr:AAA family ATPase [Chitinophagaceae bacterium]
MKLKSLHIDSYRHLENIDFDFTYPKGHEKAGKPLEKICIIGQSATGKTSILELIKNSIFQIDSIKVINDEYIFHHFQLDFNGQIGYSYNHQNLTITKNSISLNEHKYENIPQANGTITNLFTTDLRLLYLSTEIISKEVINILNQNPINISTEVSIDKYSGFLKSNKDSNYVFEFIQDINTEIWFSLLYKILDYRKRFTQMASELINKGAIGDINKLNKQYSNWSETNPNPLTEFANYFNPMLSRLNLEIDLVNTEYTIPVKSKIKDEIVPISGLSTGTKGLLLSMFPLYELDTREAIILMDEPERSLFPDIQIDLLSHYQNLAPEAQFIIATHSPFIAAAFEPEERFILYFNEEGNVAVRRGESPRGDDPNDILTNDFNVNYYNEFGKAAYRRYLDLKTKVEKETELSVKRKLVLEMSKLGDKYNF